MSQAPGDEGKSTKDSERDTAPSCLNSGEEGGWRSGWGEGGGAERLNHIFKHNKRNQIKGFYL